MKKNRKAKGGRAARSGKKARRLSRHSKKRAVSRKPSRARHVRHVAARPRQRQPAAPAVPLKKAADDVPTLEQVTITCANCGRPFKVLKLKGLSLEGTICQRCSFGEMELPESFGG